LKIYYAVRHAEILTILDTIKFLVKEDISGRNELLKAS